MLICWILVSIESSWLISYNYDIFLTYQTSPFRKDETCRMITLKIIYLICKLTLIVFIWNNIKSTDNLRIIIRNGRLFSHFDTSKFIEEAESIVIDNLQQDSKKYTAWKT